MLVSQITINPCTKGPPAQPSPVHIGASHGAMAEKMPWKVKQADVFLGRCHKPIIKRNSEVLLLPANGQCLPALRRE